MKIGIIGLPQTGKNTLYRILTDSVSDADIKMSAVGIAEIKDPRIDFLVSLYNPKKTHRARIDVALLPRIEKDSISSGKIFKDIQDMDAICHVVRAFKDDSVYHINGEVNPANDLRSVNDELLMHDLIFVEKRLQRIKDNKTKGNSDFSDKECELLLRLQEHLENNLPLRLLELSEEETKMLASYPLLTLKEMIIFLNVSEDDLKNSVFLESLEDKSKDLKMSFMQGSLKAEAEIALLDSEEERIEFLSALGIEEPSLERLSRLCIRALGLISFFTVSPDEVRQWTIRRNQSAVGAASAIHTDLGRGFIRAEVIKFTDLKELGSEIEVKQTGKFYVKGKDYIVEDGDIINVRFNV